MNTIDERSIRDQLERAVSSLDPAAPPLDALRARAVRRRRLRYSTWTGATVAAAAIVAVVLVVVPGGSGHAKVGVTTAPSSTGLKAYAAAHHGKHVAGPIETGSGYYGAFAVKTGIQVARWVDGAWRLDGAAVTKYGPGRWVVKLSDAGNLVPGSPAFAERYMGGDVSYFGGVLFRADGNWQAARYERCSLRRVSCHYPGTSQPYGHVVRDEFVSIHNDCTPSCAGGTDYRIVWRWDAAAQRFAEVSERAIQQ